jgi:hypothetical protein
MPTACDTIETPTAPDNGSPHSSEPNASCDWSPPWLLAPPGLEGISLGGSLGSLLQCESNGDSEVKNDTSSLLLPVLSRLSIDTEAVERQEIDLTDDSIQAQLKELLQKISCELDKISEDFASTAASTPEAGLTPPLIPQAENPEISIGVIGKVGKGVSFKTAQCTLKSADKKDQTSGSPFTSQAGEDSFGVTPETDFSTSSDPKRREGGRANGVGIAIVFGARGSDLAEKTNILAQANDNSLFFQESQKDIEGVPIATLAKEWLTGEDESAYCSDYNNGEEWDNEPVMLNPYADDSSPWYGEGFSDFSPDWYFSDSSPVCAQQCEDESVMSNGREWFQV